MRLRLSEKMEKAADTQQKQIYTLGAVLSGRIRTELLGLYIEMRHPNGPGSDGGGWALVARDFRSLNLNKFKKKNNKN